jgi:N-acetylglutamate synthase-like GNAT family acetyltransferase
MTERRLASLAAGNMADFERKRAAVSGASAELYFPRCRYRAEMEALVERVARSGEEVWAWRRLDDPAYFGIALKRWGFEYVFPGVLLVADTENAAPVSNRLDLFILPNNLPKETIHPWYGALSETSASTGLERDREAARRHPKRMWNLLAWQKGDTQLVGCVTLHFARGVAGLYNVAVREDVRRQGIGTAVVGSALRFAAAKGFERATLQCATGLQGFYARNGFQRVGADDAWRRTTGQAIPTWQERVATPDLDPENLRTAIEGGDFTRAVRLLERRPDLLAAGLVGMNGATPLHLAAWLGNVELVRWLLARGAPTNVRDHQCGSTPLGWAQHAKRGEIIILLS